MMRQRRLHYKLFSKLLNYVLLFSCILLLLLPAGATAYDESSASAEEEEEAALLEFVSSVTQSSSHTQTNNNNPNPNPVVCRISDSWRSGSGGPCTFCGVSCDSHGNVVSVVLRSFGLVSGHLKPNTLTSNKLPRLQILDLSGNGLSGDLPDDFAAGSSSLVSVDLSHNSFTGPIPPSLSSLQSLQSLNLSCNFLHGSIPMDLSQIPSLRFLDLHANHLSGGIHPAFLSLPSLVSVDLSDNSLAGFLPWQPNDTLPLLKTLQYVNLSRNLLAGPLAPPEFASVFAERLRVLDMSHNRLSGDLPDFEFAVDLAVLRLHDNLFTGSVPATLLSANLEELDLSANNLTGSIGRVLSTSLSVLNLSSNSLSGPIPPTSGPCSVVDLSRNRFQGDLSPMQYWSDMVELLDLSFNDLAGTLPPLDRFIRLSTLHLSHNSIAGTLPDVPPKLAALDLSFNRLTGRLPPSLLRSPTLRRLSLSDNAISGRLQLPALPLSPLLSLDLSRNQLSSSIDISGHFPNLQLLSLAGNRLSGTIPAGLCNLTSLLRLDLSANLLTGAIPDALPDSLTYLNLSGNRLTGLIPPNLRRFAASSFFPGNDGLAFAPDGHSAGSSLLGRDGVGSHMPGSVKVAIIAGTAAGFALILAVWLLLLYARLPRSAAKYGGGCAEHKRSAALGGGSSSSGSIWSACTSSCNGSSSTEAGFGSTSSAVLLQEASSARRYKAWSLTAEESAWRSSRHGYGGDVMSARSPVIRHHHDMVGTAEVIYGGGGGCGGAAAVSSSPERLAGDLYFLDNTLRFTAGELSRAPAEILGRSSHGTTYKATLEEGGVELAVKWLREGLAKNKREFGREARRFAKFRHPNLNPLRGYYWGPHHHEKLILSDYVPSGSLAAYFLHRRRPTTDDHREAAPQTQSGSSAAPALALSWEQRVAVALDVARGLHYLHEEKRQPHGNLKASNVLIAVLEDGATINAKVTARLSDYGLFQLMTADGMASQIVNAGALGYRAPEMGAAAAAAADSKPNNNNNNNKPTNMADIYAFGVLMLELVTGRCAGDIMLCGESGAVDLSDWVRLQASRGRATDCFDASLLLPLRPIPIPAAAAGTISRRYNHHQQHDDDDEGSNNNKEDDGGFSSSWMPPKGMDEMLALAILCISPDPSARPSITAVLQHVSSIAQHVTS